MAIYTGLELPIYDPEVTILSTKAQLKQATYHPESTFLRRVRIEALGCTSLLKALTMADEAFAWVCDVAQAEVVGHRWGLRRYNPQDDLHYSNVYRPSLLLPPDYMLVAEVDTIRDIETLTAAQYENIEQARKAYKQYANGNEGPSWQENCAYQFRNGHSDGSSEVKLLMLDVEPVLI